MRTVVVVHHLGLRRVIEILHSIVSKLVTKMTVFVIP